jgi:hypothetical protein
MGLALNFSFFFQKKHIVVLKKKEKRNKSNLNLVARWLCYVYPGYVWAVEIVTDRAIESSSNFELTKQV